MSPKRKSDSSFSSNKRQRTDHSEEKPKVNHTYGQIGAFPGLEDGTSDSSLVLDGAFPDDAVQYLKSVRSQALHIPTLLTSSKPHEKDNGLLYGDGAIVAAPFIGPVLPPAQVKSVTPANRASSPQQAAVGEVENLSARTDSSNEGSFDEYRYGQGGVDDYDDYDDDAPDVVPPHTAYHTRLLAEYHRIHTLISTSATQPYHELPSKAENILSQVIRARDPTSAFLARITEKGAFKAIQALVLDLRWRNLIGTKHNTKRLSAWCWGLLARLDARSLDYEEVGKVRVLGKKAVTLLERAPKKHVNFADASEPRKKCRKYPRDYSSEEEWLNALSPQEREDIELQSAAINGSMKIYTIIHSRQMRLFGKWERQSEQIRELFRRVRAVDSEITKLSQPDQTTFKDLVETARRECDTWDARRMKYQHEHLENGVDEVDSLSDPDNSGYDEESEREEGVTRAYATLDMILTIVGEVFGQRDLLEGKNGRDVCWPC